MGFIAWLHRQRKRYEKRTPKPEAKVDTAAFDALINTIIFGGHILKNPVCGRSLTPIIAEIRGLIYDAKTDLERIQLVAKYFSDQTFLDYLEIIDSGMTKHEFTVSTLKKKTIACLKNSDYEMANRCCNLAFLFTPEDSTMIPSLYVDRAMISYMVDDWEGVIQDVNEAKALGDLTQELKAELAQMKRKSIKMHGWLKRNSSDTETEKRRKYCDEILFKVHGDHHLKISSAGNYVKIAEHPVKGRMLVVTQDLRAGTTVIVEDPFVSVLTNTTNWELKQCAKCFKKTRTIVPCPDCVHTTYCSEKCRLADYKSIHKYECPCMNYFHAIDIPWSMQLGFRAISKFGPDAMFKFFKESNADIVSNGVNSKTGRYDSGYLQFYNLATHPCHEHLEYLSWYALSIAKLLVVKTDFFDKIDTEDQVAFMDFIASSLLRHSVSVPYNTMTFWDNEPTVKPVTATTLKPKPNNLKTPKRTRASVNHVFTLSSLICHSCSPSAVRVYLKNGKLAIITSRKLRAGEELTIAYGHEFSTDRLQYRSSLFVENLGFKCECVACVFKWPNMKWMHPIFEYLCPDCSQQFSYEETVSRKCMLTKGNSHLGKCNNCKKDFDMTALEEDVNKYEKTLDEGKRLLIGSYPVEAIPYFIECIEFFQYHVLSPSVPLIQAQSYLSDAHEAVITNSRLQLVEL